MDEGVHFTNWLQGWLRVFRTHLRYRFEMPTNIAPFKPYPTSKVEVLPKEFDLFKEYLKGILEISESFSFKSRKEAERVVFMLSLFFVLPFGAHYAVYSYGPKEHWIGRSAGWRKNATTRISSIPSTQRLGSTRMFAKQPQAVPIGQPTTMGRTPGTLNTADR